MVVSERLCSLLIPVLLLTAGHAVVRAEAPPASAAPSSDPGVLFQNMWQSNSSLDTRAVAWGDVNGDGTLDLVCGSFQYGSGQVELFLNRGGTLERTPSQHLGLSFGLRTGMRLGDLDGDGDLDLVCAAPRSYTYVFPNDGGVFSDQPVTVPSTYPSGICLGDTDNDGDLDLAVSAARSLMLFENSGDSLRLAWQVPVASSTGDLELGDIDGDGDLDLLCGNWQEPVAPDLELTHVAAASYAGIGLSVANAGDVNGDGYDDLIAGNPNSNAMADHSGQVYLFWGGPAADDRVDLVISGSRYMDLFGAAVSGAGDVNGDGYDDFIVMEAKGFTVDGSRAFIFFGGPDVDAAVDVTLKVPLFEFGQSVAVAGLGDINGDGFDDVIVGSPDDNMAFVYFGGPMPDDTVDLLLRGEANGDEFGWSVCGPGDVDGDGAPDILVGARLHDGGGDSAGSVYLFHGGPGADAVADLTFTGGAAGDQFGYSLSGAGDLNGDGFSDVLVGAWLNDVGGDAAGRAYVYFGGPGADSAPDLTLTGGAAGDMFGFSVSGGGDLDGDGHPDIAVGAPFNDAAGVHAGRVYVYYGGPGADAVADLTLAGDAEGDNFGRSLSGRGDLSGDGIADLVVGAPRNDAGGENAGRVHVFFGGKGFDAAADLLLTGDTIGDYFGQSVATAGDVNGDGYDDIMLGEPGRVAIHFGGPVLDPVADLIFTAEGPADGFGVAASRAGDVNGDGYDDVIIGAFRNGAASDRTGRAYIYFGGPGADSIPDAVLTGETAGDSFGRAVAAAGDVNGDGFDDVIVGVPGHDGEGVDAGRACVFLGGPQVDSEPDLVLRGSAARDFFGSAVSSAGDVNGDGFDDVIVGAPFSDAGGMVAGRACVYYGGSDLDPTPDVILTGRSAYDGFGFAVSRAGDFNGDGYADVIVGAYGNDAGESGAGQAYVFYGGATVDAVPDVVLSGEAYFDYFGSSVSHAGDVNGDAFDDVIVGAPYSDAGGIDAGRAYVFFGGAAPDGVPDLVLTGRSRSNLFGWTVAAAGDLDADGLQDFLVGAAYSPASNSLSAAVHVFRGSMGNTARTGAIFRNDGGFTAAPVWRSERRQGGRLAALGDLSGDGRLDAILGGGIPGLFLNEGGWPAAQPSWLADIDGICRSIALGDVDLDGTLDLALGEETGRIEVFLNRDNTLSHAADWQFEGNSGVAATLALGDMNNDGQLDIAVGTGGGSGQPNVVLANTGAQWFSALPVWSTATADRSQGVAVGDIDLDGYPDAAFANDGVTKVYFGDGGGLSTQPGWSSGYNFDTKAVALGPVTPDGLLDLVCGNYGTFTTLFSDVRVGGGRQPSWVASKAFPTTSIQLGDIDGDGDLDLVSGNRDDRLNVAFNTGGSFSPITWLSQYGQQTSGVALGDVDRDGDPDILCSNFSTGSTLFRNDGGIPTYQPAWRSSDESASSVALGDVNGDGRIDAVFGYVYGQVGIYPGYGEAFTSAPAWISTAASASPIVALKDVNIDGRMDLICATNGSPSLRVHANRDTIPSVPPDWVSGSAADTRGLAVADVDGDGDMDLVSANFGQPSTVHAGLRNPAYKGDPASPVNQLPNTMATIRDVWVERVPGRVQRIHFTAFDAEGDRIWLFPQYRVVPGREWHPLAGHPPRIGPLAASPQGVEHELDWDVSALPAGFSAVELRLRWTSNPGRAGLIQAAGTYIHEIPWLQVRKPVLVPLPPVVSMATVTVGDTTAVELKIENSGNQVLTVSEVRLPIPELSLLSGLPLEVSPRTSQVLRVQLAPKAAIPESVAVEIETNDPLNPRLVLTLKTRVLELQATVQVASEEDPLPLGRPVVILVTPGPEVHIENGWLFHRVSGSASAFADSIRLVRLTGEFIANIPGQSVTEAGIDFFVRVENSDVIRSIPDGAPGNYISRQATPPDRVTAEPQENSSLGYLAGQSVQVLFFLPVGSLFQSGTLHFREGGETAYRQTEVTVTGQLPSAVIPDSVVGHRGIEYWVEMTTASGAVLRDPSGGSAGPPRCFATTVRSLEETAVHPAGRYRMISFPLDFGPDFTETIAPILIDEEELGPYDPSRWRCFRYVTGESLHVELSDPESAARFRPAPGRAFWLISRDAHRIDSAPVVTRSVPLGSSYEVVLEPGWNQIGDPWSFPVAWADARVDGLPVLDQDLVEAPVCWDPAAGSGGAYLPDQDVLIPFEGYWVKNAGTESLTLEFPPTASSDTPFRAMETATSPDPEGWRIRVAASAAGLHDLADAGIHPGALDGRDRRDRSDPPPPPGPGLSIYFPHGDWAVGPGSYATDIRSDAESGWAWAFDVSGNYDAPEEVTELRVEFDVTQVPRDLGVFLLDRELRHTHDLRTAGEYRVHSGARDPVTREEDSRFLIVVGPEDYVRERQEEMEQPPLATRLFLNRPNPFAGSTVIRYELAGAGPTEIRIHDVRGRLIRVLVRGMQGPGILEAAWDGRDDLGRIVPWGSYYCVLSATGLQQTRKINRIPHGP